MPVPADELGWRKYLPVRKMTAEEYEKYQRRKAVRERHRWGTVQCDESDHAITPLLHDQRLRLTSTLPALTRK